MRPCEQRAKLLPPTHHTATPHHIIHTLIQCVVSASTISCSFSELDLATRSTYRGVGVGEKGGRGREGWRDGGRA